ncbi:hypothetical protein IKE67_02860 [bacterium]|nr:hypothetical protein [bacterium]
MKKILVIFTSFLFIFTLVQKTFANNEIYTPEIENIYQEKVFKAYEKKYDMNNLSDFESTVLKNLIQISNKKNYKLIIKILKNDNIENLNKISNIEINSNLSANDADKKNYETAYIILRKGLFTEFPNEKLIKPTIKMMYDCENKIEIHNLAVYGAAFLYHKENNYNLKELLDNTNKNNYKEKLKEIISGSECDMERFFPECKEMSVLVSNMPQKIKEEIGINEVKPTTLSTGKCIVNPNYYATNMILLSTGMDGANKKGAVVGLINPLNIVSDVLLAPIYLMGKYLRPAIQNMKEFNL